MYTYKELFLNYTFFKIDVVLFYFIVHSIIDNFAYIDFYILR